MYTDVTHSVDVLPFKDDSEGLPIANIFAPLLIEDAIKAKERMPNADSPGGKELKNVWEIFYTGGKPAKRIFMKGEAGCGKTFFCLKLLDTWCQVKQSGTVTDDVLQQCLAVFDLVFYLPLRHDKGNITSVNEMIGQTVSEQCLNLLACGGRIHCLVILDGLDESPVTFRELPSMRGIVSYVLFCTTRPWKLTQFQLKYKPDDKVVQILGLLPSSEKEVIEYVLVNFYKLKKDTSEFKKKFERYSSMLQESSLETLVKIPMMLTACCCAWYEEDARSEQLKGKQGYVSIYSPAVHTSMTHTYLSLVDSMIRRADEKYDLRSLLTQACPLSRANIPNIIASFSYINNFVGALLPLCRLACTDLVSDDTKLVFQKDELERKIGHPLVEIALKVGLISQTKAPGRFLQENVSVNFYHKSIQEVMAAIHLSCTDSGDIKSYCTSLDKVMDVANIIVFGITLDSSLSKHVMNIVNTDPDIQQYRRTLGYNDMVKQLYKTQCQWYRELTHSRAVTGDMSPPPSLHITDIWLWEYSDRDAVRLTGELMCANRGTIVSVTLWRIDHPLNRVAHYLPQCPNLSALYITCMRNKENNNLLVSVIPHLTQLTTIRYYGVLNDTAIEYEGGNLIAARHRGAYVGDLSDAGRSVVAAIMALRKLVRVQLYNVSLVYLNRGFIFNLNDDRLDDESPGDVGVEVTYMTQLKTVRLDRVHMTAGKWGQFLSSLLTLRQAVNVVLSKTNIDRETVLRIRTSPRLTVTEDDSRGFGSVCVRLEFTTSPSHLSVTTSPSHLSVTTSPSHNSVTTSPSHLSVTTSPSHLSVTTSPSHHSVTTSPSHLSVTTSPSHLSVTTSPSHHSVTPSPCRCCVII